MKTKPVCSLTKFNEKNFTPWHNYFAVLALHYYPCIKATGGKGGEFEITTVLLEWRTKKRLDESTFHNSSTSY